MSNQPATKLSLVFAFAIGMLDHIFDAQDDRYSPEAQQDNTPVATFQKRSAYMMARCG